jgi:hypothetical protein
VFLLRRRQHLYFCFGRLRVAVAIIAQYLPVDALRRHVPFLPKLKINHNRAKWADDSGWRGGEARLSSNTGGIFAKAASTSVDDSRDPNTVPACKCRPVTQLSLDGAGTVGGGGGDRARVSRLLVRDPAPCRPIEPARATRGAGRFRRRSLHATRRFVMRSRVTGPGLLLL